MKKGFVLVSLILSSLLLSLFTISKPVLAQECVDNDNNCPAGCTPDRDIDCLFENASVFEEGFENYPNDSWTVETKGGATVSVAQDQKYGEGIKSLKIFNDGQSGSSATVIHQLATPTTGRLSLYFYDDLLSKGMLVSVHDGQTPPHGIGIGVNTGAFGNYYYYRSGPDPRGMNSFVARTKDWHRLEIIVTPKGSYAKVDGINLSYLPGNGPENGHSKAVVTNCKEIAKITINSPGWGQSGTAYFDNLKLQPFAPIPQTVEEREYYLIKRFFTDYPNIVALAKGTTGLGIERTKSQLATVLAFRYLKENDPALLAPAIDLIDLSNKEYTTWGWGKKWLSGTAAYSLALSSWLIWDKLNDPDHPNLQNSIKNTIFTEAEFWTNRLEVIKANPDKADDLYKGWGWTYQKGFSRYIDDTSLEDNATTAMFLSVAAQMFLNDSWEKAARTYGFHVSTTSDPKENLCDNSKYGLENGRNGQLYNELCSQTLYSDFLSDNHGYHPHPGYTVMGLGLYVAIPYERTGKQLPVEFLNNEGPAWNAIKEYFDFSDYTYFGEKIRDLAGRGCNLFAETDKDDWGAGPVHPLVFGNVDKFLGGGGSFMDSLTEYDYYITPDYLAFPPKLQINLAPERIACQDDAFYYNAPASGMLGSNAGSVFGHAITLLAFDTNIKLKAVYPEGDLNKDFLVTNQDIKFLLGKWGAAPTSLLGVDSNNDGQVNGFDFGKIKRLVALAPPPPPSTPTPSALLISNIWTASGKTYTQGVLNIGVTYYVDKTYTVSSLPAGFSNLKFIKTAHGDRYRTEEVFLKFNINRPADVYVAFDRRATALPNWLRSFTNTGLRITVKDAPTDYLKLYQKTFNPGTVTLGGNAAAGGDTKAPGPYIVIIK